MRGHNGSCPFWPGIRVKARREGEGAGRRRRHAGEATTAARRVGRAATRPGAPTACAFGRRDRSVPSQRDRQGRLTAAKLGLAIAGLASGGSCSFGAGAVDEIDGGLDRIGGMILRLRAKDPDAIGFAPRIS